MIDHALHLLTLYIIWKARGLTHAAEPTPDEARLRTRLKECRDLLVEKLLEFAIGTQSNTADGVKRAVRFILLNTHRMFSCFTQAFQNLMNLHILFAPPQPDADDANVPPTATLPLTLDEEVQYRCAGFVQAEIERYAEDMEELSPPASEESDLTSDNGRSDGEEKKSKRKGKGKQPERNGTTSMSISFLYTYFDG